MEQAKDVYFDEIMKLISNVAIPDLEDADGNYLRDNTFTLEDRVDKVEFTTDVANNAIVLTCKKLTASFRSGEFRYKVAPLVVSKGHVEVDMNTVDIGVGLSFSLQTLPDGRVVPAVNSVDLLVDIDRWDIRIHMFGNFWTDLASLFEVFFKSVVVDLI